MTFLLHLKCFPEESQQSFSKFKKDIFTKYFTRQKNKLEYSCKRNDT